MRQALGRAFSLTCSLLQANPARLLRYEWKLGSRLLTVGQLTDQNLDTSYHVKALNREGHGEYTCDITNEAGAGRCTYLVTGEADRLDSVCVLELMLEAVRSCRDVLFIH